MCYILLLLLCLISESVAVFALKPSSAYSAKSSNSSSGETALSAIFPYRYDIPDSPFHLNIGFVLPRRPLDSGDLRSLLIAAQAVARKGTEDHGSEEPLPATTGLDVFHYSLGAGITVSITEGYYAVTWGILEVVLRGLKNYLVDGRRPYWTRFEFTVASMPVYGFGTVRGTEARVDVH